MRNFNCLRCNSKMNHLGTRKFQLGQTGWFLGDLPNLFAGAIEVDIYTCPSCGKIEFFMPKRSENGIAMVTCPKCGHKHEMDYPKCPFCKYDYNNK